MVFFDRIKQLSSRRGVRIGFAFLLILASIILWRSCTKEGRVQKRTFAVARSSNISEMRMSGKEPNLLAFEDDIIDEIARMEDLKLYVVTLNYTNLLEPLRQEEYDAVLMFVDPDAMMTHQYHLSEPLFGGGPVLIVAQDSQAAALQDLKGRGIGIQSGSPLLFKLNQQDLLLVTYPSMIAALDDLEKGILGGVIMESHLAKTYTQGFYRSRLKIASKPLTKLGIRLISLNNAEGEFLIENFNKGLNKTIESGRYDRLIEKWELND